MGAKKSFKNVKDAQKYRKHGEVFGGFFVGILKKTQKTKQKDTIVPNHKLLGVHLGAPNPSGHDIPYNSGFLLKIESPLTVLGCSCWKENYVNAKGGWKAHK